MARGEFRRVDGREIFWRDDAGRIHACQGANVHPGVRLIWTLCERDVPAGKAYTSDPPQIVSCSACAAEASLG